MATIIIPTFAGVASELTSDTFTFLNAYSGEEFALGDRSLLFCLASNQNDITTAPSAVTYGGVGATKLAEFGAEGGSTFDWYLSLWRLDSPSGNNADVVATSAGGHNRHLFLQVLAAYDLGDYLDFGTDESLSANQLDLSLNTQDNGAVVAILGRYNNSSSAVNGTWGVNFVDDKKASQHRGPFDEIGVNWDIAASTESPRTVTATISNPGGSLLGVGGLSVSFTDPDVTGEGVLASDGIAAGSFVGALAINGVLASDGVATAGFTGQATVDGALASAGIGAGAFVGTGDTDNILESIGVATVAWVGISNVGAWTSDGIAAGAFVGTYAVDAVWASNGVASAFFSDAIDGILTDEDSLATVEWVGSALGGDNWIAESPPSGTWTPEAGL